MGKSTQLTLKDRLCVFGTLGLFFLFASLILIARASYGPAIAPLLFAVAFFYEIPRISK